MNAIRINVNKQMDGYAFSTTPSSRALIRKLSPNAHPANTIFVGYDTKSDFEVYIGKLENTSIPLCWEWTMKMILKNWTKSSLLTCKQEPFYSK